MAGKKRPRKKKITQKEIFIICIVAVLIIALFVILTTDNKLNNYLVNYWAHLQNEQDVSTGQNGDDTAIVSGNEIVILPAYFDLQNLLQIHFVDIGQGEAIIIKLPDGKIMLIDSGTNTAGLAQIREKYLSYLANVAYPKVIDYMIITHADSDHYNMLTSVVENYQVQCAYYNQAEGTAYNKFLGVLANESGIILYEVDDKSMTFIIDGDGYTMTLYCCGDSAFESANDKNNQSFVCLLEYGGRSILFTGDAGTETESWFMEEIEKPYMDIDVLNVGHHGSNTSTSDEFLQFIDAEYAIISCDDGSLHGHPHQVVMNRLSLHGLVTYRTNRHGNILLCVDGDGDFGFWTQKSAATENNTQSTDDRRIPSAA